MRSSCCVLTVLALAAAAAAAGEDAPKLAAGPAAKAEADGVRITFTLAAPTDVAVDVVDAGGKVVRHLGSAALGAKNPPPPFTAGLAQSILWDRKDDAGRPVGGGMFRARVRLGLAASFDRFIRSRQGPSLGHCSINGLAVTPDRRLIVLFIDGIPPMAGRTENRICVLSRDGRYERTIYPFAASADPQALRGVDFLSAAPGRLAPRVYDRICISYLPFMRALPRQTMATTADGRLVLTSGWGTELYRFGPRKVLVMNADGTIPRQRLDGPVLAEGVNAGFPHLAVSPDAATVYACGLHFRGYVGKPHHVVYHAPLKVDATAAVFFGTKGEAGGGKDGLNDPRGIAVDARGNVYVSDYGNDRIVVLDAAGRYVGEIAVKGPEVLAVHPKTGAIYVVSILGGSKYRLVKLTAFPGSKPTAELDLTRYGGVTRPATHFLYHPVLALDPHGDRPIVYLGSPSTWARYRLMRIEDAADGLKPTVIQSLLPTAGPAFPYPQGVGAADRFFFLELSRSVAHGNLIRGWEFDGAASRLVPWLRVANNTYRYVAGRDGLLYRGAWYQGNTLSRVSRDGKVVPFSATGDASEPYVDHWHFRRNNLHVRPDGSIWMLHFLKRSSVNALVSKMGTDGRMQRKGVVEGLQAPVGVRVDSRGNIYVADGLKPADQMLPPEIDRFARRLRAAGTTPRGHHGEAVEDAYGEAYGSVLKFGPDGGRVRPVKQAEPSKKLLASYPGRRQFIADGLLAACPRISPMSPPRSMEFSACWCLAAFFDLDGYDRLFVPDAMQFCVRVLDANLNEILRFGGYDRAEPGAAPGAGGPPIPFEFPTWVNVSDAAAYVADAAPCAHRVVRVRLGYRREALTAPFKP
jgi:sugar lactone lactonase YvrE